MASNFEVIPGDPASQVILHVPHAARFIPAEVRSEILLNDLELLAELDAMTDSRTDEIALAATEQLIIKPWLFINRFSRLVIDPERFPDDREIMNKVGMGAVYRKTSTNKDLRSSDFSGEKELLDAYFHPYAKALEELVTTRIQDVGELTIIDVHSYRPEQHENAVNHGQQRPAMCIGTDQFHTPPELKEAAQLSFSLLGDVYENEPYAGTYVPLKYYGVENRVRSIMMETRADTFLDDAFNFHVGAHAVIRGLADLISKIGDAARGK
jgi:predicted N-formylglutamate amidohydrolase